MKRLRRYRYIWLLVLVWLLVTTACSSAQPLKLVSIYEGVPDSEGIVVIDQYAYLSGTLDGFVILDVSDPTQPRYVGSYDPKIRKTGARIVQAAIVEDYAYISVRAGGLRIVDISDPALPVEVGSFTQVSDVKEVTIKDHYAYLDTGREGVQILDITEPTTPALVGTYLDHDFTNDLYLAGNKLYLIVRPTREALFDELRILDITNPINPIELGWFNDLSDGVANVAVAGDYAYITDSSQGLTIVDVSDPRQPVKVTSFDTRFYPQAVKVVGNTIYLSDTDHVLVIDISKPAEPRVVASHETEWARDVAISDKHLYVTDSNLLIFEIP